MKNVLLIVIVICINSCRMPADPLGEIKIIKRLDTIDTGGNCLDLDVDIIDNILVAAANYNGYFVYKIKSEAGVISDITELIHKSADDMDPSLGDNRAQSVILSKENNISFVMDQYDHIWLYKYDDGANQYDSPSHLEELCYGGVWLSVAIDDQLGRIGIYSLLKHNAAEFTPYCVHEDSLMAVPGDEGCSAILEIQATEYSNQIDCLNEEGYIWMYPGCPSQEYNEYSTSIVWKNLEEVAFGSTSLIGEPNCEYIINQGSVADKIYFADGLLSQAYGELGVRVFQKTDIDICLINGAPSDISDSLQCDFHKFPAGDANAGEKDYRSCCENLPCQGFENCEHIDTYIENNGYPGFGGLFSSAGGILRRIFSEFDTAGEVEALYSSGYTIFAGLSHSNGCIISILNDNGEVSGSNQFAVGYTIKGIHEHNGLLALAAGNDGILLYNWNGGTDVSFIGKIETSYANNVKVAGDIIFAATEDGIEIIQIENNQ